MLTQATIDKMHTMKMASLAEAFERQIRSPECAQMSFEERVGMMIDTEHDAREQRKLTRRLQWARLRHQASLEDVDWHSPRGLDRQVVLALGRCGWIREHQNLLITGPTGVGKSWLACAFAERVWPVRALGLLHPGPAAAPRPLGRARRRLLRAGARSAGEDGAGGPRRLRPDPAQGPGAAGPP